VIVGGGTTIVDDEMEDGEDGEQQLDALADQYMMKSPVTMALRRKSSVAPSFGQIPSLLSMGISAAKPKGDPKWLRAFKWDKEVELAN
jgi:hypothetical protein